MANQTNSRPSLFDVLAGSSNDQNSFQSSENDEIEDFNIDEEVESDFDIERQSDVSDSDDESDEWEIDDECDCEIDEAGDDTAPSTSAGLVASILAPNGGWTIIQPPKKSRKTGPTFR